MDQFTAHLDRGWDLAQRGDAAGAEASARRALELEADSPEAHNLLGFSCALRGEHDEALDYYVQAISLDDTFLEAILNAAEICIFPIGDFESALAYCDDAIDLVETDDELTDALLLKFDALMGLGRSEDAVAVCNRIPVGPYENPHHAFLVGRAKFETGQAEDAEKLLQDAMRRDPDNPEAPYYLAMILDERGDSARATQAFLKSLQLDAELPPFPWSLSRDAFQETVQQALLLLNPRLRAVVDAKELYVADAPGVEVVVDGADPRAPILLDDAGDGRGQLLRVFIYQRNIERLAGNVDRIADTITATLESEIASAVFGERPPPEGDRGALN